MNSVIFRKNNVSLYYTYMADIYTDKYLHKYSSKIHKTHTCNSCDYNTSSLKDYDKHILTRKHRILTNTYIKDKFSPTYDCICGKQYKHRQSMHKHKKICPYANADTNTDTNADNDTYTNENTVIVNSDNKISTTLVEKTEEGMPDMKELIIALMTQNQNMQKQMLEMMPHLGNTTNTMTNSNNNTNNFNVNMFLNEHCQNAMNISDFIESLPITHKELDNTRKYGLSESISNMVIKGLDDMSIYERPIHCTDPSRKTVYVRDNDEWVKDDNNVIMQRNAVRLAVKQRNNVKLWRDQYLEGKESDRTHLDYHDMALNCLKYIETDEKEKNKIVKKICQATHLTVDVKQKLMNM